MLLAADIGNTNITLGIYETGRLKNIFRLITEPSGTPEAYGQNLLLFLRDLGIQPQAIEGVVIASVVPDVMSSFADGVRSLLKQEPFIVDHNSKTGITIKTDFPDKVGVDRLVNAASAYYSYGGPALVVDFGTATTFDVVSGNGEFLGGVIAPGIKICAEALWEKTAKLPKIEIQKPDRVMGTNTVSSMQSGVYFGYLGQVEYLVDNLKKELGCNLKTIATGGLSNLFKGFTDVIDIYDADLTLNGLKYLYEINHSEQG